MLLPRIIPCLLLHGGDLVKTVGFASPKYIGDPINAVRIFNEKEADEIIIADIDAAVCNRGPDYGMIRSLAAECRMPMCYVGGVNTLEQIERIITLGVEKVGLSSGAIKQPKLIEDAARRVGSQSITVVLDVRAKATGGYEIFTHNGTRETGLDPEVFARHAVALGAGEIVVNSIDQDGGMAGYDFQLLSGMRKAVDIPLTALGGAGSLKDVEKLVGQLGTVGAAAGSMFVFKGKYRAVLISYPGRSEKYRIVNAAGH
jgi:cyclase